jgi:ADP-L-glycero-D-manno-heptose 6-epimerase
LAHAIFAALNLPQQIDFVDMPSELRDKYQYFTCANIGKLRAAGWNALVTPLTDAVLDYVRNYLVPGRRLGDEPSNAE